VNALRVVVVDRDGWHRAALMSRLRQLGVEQVEPAGDAAAVSDGGSAGPPDLVLCALNIGETECPDFLRKLAALPPAPAVAIHGPADDLTKTENLCQRLGLRYLGHLSHPLQADRLERMLLRLREFRESCAGP
jgi:CheY-like chemotaxis protein